MHRCAIGAALELARRPRRPRNPRKPGYLTRSLAVIPRNEPVRDRRRTDPAIRVEIAGLN
jgi:hypothetical protein